MYYPHSPLPPATTGLDLILLLDKRPTAASRRQLVAWSQRCATRRGLGFICGNSPRVIGQTSRGLRNTIYNAGSREIIPFTDLLGWLTWQRLVIIENGHCCELPLTHRQLYAAPLAAPATEALAYQRLGRSYTDR